LQLSSSIRLPLGVGIHQPGRISEAQSAISLDGVRRVTLAANPP